MSYLRQKRQTRTYWAELGFLVLGLLGLQPSLFTSLITGAQTKPANYYEPQNQNSQYQNSQYQNSQYQNSQYQNSQYQNSQYSDLLHSALSGLAAQVQNLGPQHNGSHWTPQPVPSNVPFPGSSSSQQSYQNPSWQAQPNYASVPGHTYAPNQNFGQPVYNSAQSLAQPPYGQQAWNANSNQWNNNGNNSWYNSSNANSNNNSGYANQNYNNAPNWSANIMGTNHASYSPSLYGQANSPNYMANQPGAWQPYQQPYAQASNGQPFLGQSSSTSGGYNPLTYGQPSYGPFNSPQSNYNANNAGNWQRYQPNSGSSFYR